MNPVPNPTTEKPPLVVPLSASPSVPLALHQKIRRAGWIVLVLGVISGALIYLLAARQPAAPDWSQDRGYNAAMERMGGKLSIYLADFNHWLGSLWSGPQLGLTVAALAVLLALACFWWANFLSIPMPDDEEPPGV